MSRNLSVLRHNMIGRPLPLLSLRPAFHRLSNSFASILFR